MVRYRDDPPPASDPEGHSQATFLPAKRRKGVPVEGWGVEIVLKKMEYSSVDDRAGNGSQEREAGETDGGRVKEKDTFLNERLGDDPWKENSVALEEEEISRQFLSTAIACDYFS